MWWVTMSHSGWTPSSAFRNAMTSIIMARLRITLLAITLIFACVRSQTTSENDKVVVAVYYESLCPDSRSFINSQLYPALTEHNGTLAARVDLQLVPYGKSSYIYDKSFKEYNFSCHHGANECAGNKVHACGLQTVAEDVVASGEKTTFVSRPALDFVNCLMARVDRTASTADKMFPIAGCALDSPGVHVAKVENCARHIDGQRYLAEYGVQTERLRPPLTSVPTVTFQGTHDADESGRAVRNFVGALCHRLRQLATPPPEVCDTAAAVATANIATMALVLIAALLVVF